MEFDVSDRVETKVGDAFHLRKFARIFKPHIVEMVGLIDYLSGEPRGGGKKSLVDTMFEYAKEALEDDGILLTATTMSSIERVFVKEVINWRMIYRTEEDLFVLAEKAGFKDARIILEVLGFYAIMEAYK